MKPVKVEKVNNKDTKTYTFNERVKVHLSILTPVARSMQTIPIKGNREGTAKRSLQNGNKQLRNKASE